VELNKLCSSSLCILLQLPVNCINDDDDDDDDDDQQVAAVVMILTCIQEVTGWKFHRVVDYLDCSSSWFSSNSPENAGAVTSYRPRLSTSEIHFMLLIHNNRTIALDSK
jgi:hypothetical protein